MKELINKYAFPTVCAVGIILAFSVGGVVIGGILMGIISTIAIWMSIKRFPMWMQRWMFKSRTTVFISDIVFLKLTAGIMMLLSSGVTVVCAVLTQMVILGVLMDNARDQKGSIANGTITVHAEPCG